jgi:hypothetical protein
MDWANMLPRDRTDFRERIRRETLIGKLTLFHENIEMYIFRQAKAYTTTRVAIHWLLIYLLTAKCKKYNKISNLCVLIHFPRIS